MFLGNHEYMTMDVDNWLRYLATLGFTVLHNSNVHIRNDGDDVGGTDYVCLAGVDDWTADKNVLLA